MKAVELRQFGEPADALHVVERAIPTPGPGEVLVRMLASPLNPSDLSTVRGSYTRLPQLPSVPGYEGVGRVESAGKGLLGRFLQGRRVAFLSAEGGSWREFNVVPARQAVPISSAIPDEQAATFFVNPMTAYALTREVLRVPSGGLLVQTAAASVLGHMVIRLGKQFGFQTLNVVRREEQAQELRSAGADRVIVAATANDVERKIREATGSAGALYALDCVSGDIGSAVVKCLGPQGRMVVFGTMSGQPLSFSSRDLMTPGATIEGFWLGNFMSRLSLVKKLRMVREVGRLIKEGVLASHISATFPLDQIHQAIAQSESPGRGGKVLLRMNGDMA